MVDDNFPTEAETNAAFEKATAPTTISLPQQPQVAAPIQQDQQTGQPVNVFNPDGDLVAIPHEHLQNALSQGYTPATDEDVNNHFKQLDFGTPGQQAKTFLEGAGEGASFGLSTGLERAMGVKGEDILARKEVNPGTNMLGQMTGIVGSTLIPGVGEANLLEKAGTGITKLAGLADAAGILPKIGSLAARGAVESALISGGDEVSKALAGDPNQTAESVAGNISLAALIGAPIGVGFGSVSPLWKAAQGSKLGQILNKIVSKVGGIEGVEPNAVDSLAQTAGMDLAPEVRSAMTSEPYVRQWAKELEQTDTNASGLEFQQTIKDNLHKQASDVIADALGTTIEDVPNKADISKREVGKTLGQTLAKEYSAQIEPLTNEFEALKSKYKDTPLIQDGTVKGGLDYTDPYAPKEVADKVVSGTASTITNNLSNLAMKEGWIGAKNDISNELNRVLTQLPKQKTLSDLTNLETQVGNNTKSTLPFGQQTPLSRAGMLMKGVIRNAADDLATQSLGEEAPELVQRLEAAKDSYRQQSLIKEALNDRLHINGSTAGFAKGLREMAQTDGEVVLNRLSGTKDADLLNLLQKSFPETAAVLKDYHINNLLAGAKDGDIIKAKAFQKGLEKMSPELRNFAIPPEVQQKVTAIHGLLSEFEALPHDFSNAARTIDKLTQKIPGSVVGMISMLISHNPIMAALLGGITKTISKDVPDAVKLALLKKLGTKAATSPTGFKAATEYIQALIKGTAAVSRATGALFKTGAKVLPEGTYDRLDLGRDKLDRSLQSLQTNPEKLQSVGGEIGHYMPDHAGALAQVASRGVTYLNSIRPNTDLRNPLDSKIEAAPYQKAAFNNALDIAQQPLVVIDKMKQGTLTPQDLIHLKAIYPNLYTQLQQKVSQQMIEAVHKGETIPYKTKLSTSLFLGQPLDSTMTPQAIVSAQPMINAIPPQKQGMVKGKGEPKHSATSLSKVSKLYTTPEQAAEADKVRT